MASESCEIFNDEKIAQDGGLRIMVGALNILAYRKYVGEQWVLCEGNFLH